MKNHLSVCCLSPWMHIAGHPSFRINLEVDKFWRWLRWGWWGWWGWYDSVCRSHVNDDVSTTPGELVTLPLGLGEHDDLLVPDLLKQPGKLRLLLVLVAHVHDLSRQENLQGKFKWWTWEKGRSFSSVRTWSEDFFNIKKESLCRSTNLEDVVVGGQVGRPDVDVHVPEV